MNADELTTELERWNRNAQTAGSNYFLFQVTAYSPTTCTPLPAALRGYPQTSSVENLDSTNSAETVDGLRPCLTPYGELEYELFHLRTLKRLPAPYNLPTCAADELLAELRQQNDSRNRCKGYLDVTLRTRYWQTRRTVAMPDADDLTDEEAHDARTAHLAANLEGVTTTEETGSRNTSRTFAGESYDVTSSAWITTFYDTAANTYTLQITAETASAHVTNLRKVPIKVLALWQDLPYEVQTTGDTSGSGTPESDPQIVPYWTAPAGISISCTVTWDPAEAGYSGMAPYAETWSAWPTLKWNYPAESVLQFSEAIENLTIESREVQIQPGEEAEILAPPFSLPEVLTVEDLTKYQNLKTRRRLWLAYRI